MKPWNSQQSFRETGKFRTCFGNHPAELKLCKEMKGRKNEALIFLLKPDYFQRCSWGRFAWLVLFGSSQKRTTKTALPESSERTRLHTTQKWTKNTLLYINTLQHDKTFRRPRKPTAIAVRQAKLLPMKSGKHEAQALSVLWKAQRSKRSKLPWASLIFSNSFWSSKKSDNHTQQTHEGIRHIKRYVPH